MMCLSSYWLRSGAVCCRLAIATGEFIHMKMVVLLVAVDSDKLPRSVLPSLKAMLSYSPVTYNFMSNTSMFVAK